MKTLMSRSWTIMLAFGAIALFAVMVFAAQSLSGIGRLVPFADPTDSPDNDVFFGEPSILHKEVTAWHYHTGPWYGVVRQGTLIEDLGCGKVKEFPAGTGFHTPAFVVHRWSNAGETELQMTVFQIYHHGDPITVVATEPTCP